MATATTDASTTLKPEAKETGIVSPIKLAHVVLRTSRMPELMAWYKVVLNAKVSHESENIAFLAYDDEHHRIAFVSIPNLGPQPSGIVGVHHFAFTYASLKDLLGNYVRLRDLGIEPTWPINHGPTTSIYYTDPDGNQVELQVDNYDTVEESGEFMATDAFSINPIGVDFDPDEILRRLEAGEDETALKRRPSSGPRDVDTIRLR